MDKISKALGKLTNKEREIVKVVLTRLSKNNIRGFDVKKLKGREDIFRIRKGKLRIIYRLTEDKKTYIIAIDRRSEDTYKF